MAHRHRDFGSSPGTPKEPITFTLAGETFTALPEAPGAALNDLASGITLDEKGYRVYSAPNLIAFVTAVLVEEEEVEGEDGTMERVPTDDVERFLALMRDKRRVVPIDTLGEVVMWLAEEYGDRPSPPSARSARGRR